MTGRIILVPFSPRVAPGLLSAAAWKAVTGEGARVHAGDAEHPILEYLDDQDVAIELIEGETGEVADELLKEAAAGETVVWLADPSGGDQPLVLALGERLTNAEADAPDIELELLPGSYDVPGARLLDLVAVMDRLRSPGGCPWDSQQTHQSLVKYLLEEAYETVETIEDGDPDTPGEGRDALREELSSSAVTRTCSPTWTRAPPPTWRRTGSRSRPRRRGAPRRWRASRWPSRRSH